MTQFATNAELAARLGLTLTEDEGDRADTLLALASGLIQAETGQTIAAVSDDELTRPGDYSARLRLPERPVVSVTSITLDGVAIVKPDYYLDGDELVRANWPIGSENNFGSSGLGWLGPLYTLVITYSHGYETIPELVKAVCLEMVARVWVNPGAASQEIVAGTSTTYSARGLLLTDQEKRDLDDLLRKTVGSLRSR
jgi:hypothetical protein